MSAPTPVAKTKPCPDCKPGQVKQIALKSTRCIECHARQTTKTRAAKSKERQTQFVRRENTVTLAARPAKFSPVTNHLSGAPTPDMSVAIRDGFALFGPSGFDLHKNNAARMYQAKAKRTAPATGCTAVTRHWKNNRGDFEEAPLSLDGRFTR